MIKNAKGIWREEIYEGGNSVKANAARKRKAQETQTQLLKWTSTQANNCIADDAGRLFNQGYQHSYWLVPKNSTKNRTQMEQVEIQKPVRPAAIRTSNTSQQVIQTFVDTHNLNVTAEIWIWFYSMDNATPVRTFISPDKKALECTANIQDSQKRGFYIRCACAYIKRQAQREPAPSCEETAGNSKKRALKPNAKFRLCFEDESSFNLYPYLTRLWHKKGQQVKVPTPGKNRKLYVFGVIEYKRGKFFYHVQDKNNQWGCMAVIQQLIAWARSIGVRVILVWDNARTHTAKRLQAYLNQPHVRKWVKIFWLSTYSPDLNDIERLWRYLKRTGVANHLFKSFQEFKDHLISLLKNVNKNSSEVSRISFNISKNIAHG